MTTVPVPYTAAPAAKRPLVARRLPVARVVLTAIAVAFLTLFVVVPAVNVFTQALSNGWDAYRSVFFPEPTDEVRLAQIRARLDEIQELPLRQRRAFDEERRTLKREESAMLAVPDHARLNWSSVRMTAGIAAVVVPLNLLFGVACAWAVTKFRFKGRSLLISVIELPFSVSPVVAGLIFVLLFGAQGFLAAWAKSDRAMYLAPAIHALRWSPLVAIGGVVLFLILLAILRRVRPGAKLDASSTALSRNVSLAAALVVLAVLVTLAYLGPNPGWTWLLPTEWKWPDPTSLYWRGFGAGSWWPIAAGRTYEGVIFTPLAISLASIFVTFPFVARNLIPLMEAQGAEAEQAALTLGAGGWYMFRRVTLPSIKWGLLYGTILCTARALGEFGAVSVVSGHLDANDTMPLRVEKLWQAYKTQPAFTVASLLAMTAVLTLVLKGFIEWMTRRSGETGRPAGRPGH